MTKLIRHAVSGKNRRYIDEDLDLDLDLTYITPRIVAMGYPSTGFESSYRNPAKEVSSLLESKHSGHYTVFNLTDRTYDTSIFPTAQVLSYPFPDHHAPPFSLLIEILKKMDEIYKSEDDSVLVLHCLAGHGRTGTVISSFLIYEDMYQTPEEALAFFARKRSYKDKGVSHPSQKRAVYYAYSYKQMMITEKKSIFSQPPKIQRKIEKIIFKNLFFENNSKNIQSITLVLLNSKFETIYDSSNLNLKSLINENSNADPNSKETPKPFSYNATELCFNIDMTVEDDITVKVYKSPKILLMQTKKKEIFRITFNMIFCNNYGVAFPKWDIDGPHKDVNNEKFPSSMCVCIEMEPPSGRKNALERIKIDTTESTDNENENTNDKNNDSDIMDDNDIENNADKKENDNNTKDDNDTNDENIPKEDDNIKTENNDVKEIDNINDNDNDNNNDDINDDNDIIDDNAKDQEVANEEINIENDNNINIEKQNDDSNGSQTEDTVEIDSK